MTGRTSESLNDLMLYKFGENSTTSRAVPPHSASKVGAMQELHYSSRYTDLTRSQTLIGS